MTLDVSLEVGICVVEAGVALADKELGYVAEAPLVVLEGDVKEAIDVTPGSSALRIGEEDSTCNEAVERRLEEVDEASELTAEEIMEDGVVDELVTLELERMILLEETFPKLAGAKSNEGIEVVADGDGDKELVALAVPRPDDTTLTIVVLVILDAVELATEDPNDEVDDNMTEVFAELKEGTIDGEAITAELVVVVLTTDEVAMLTELVVDVDEGIITVSLK